MNRRQPESREFRTLESWQREYLPASEAAADLGNAEADPSQLGASLAAKSLAEIEQENECG